MARELSEVISMRLSAEDKARLDAIAKRLPIKRLTIARVAMRIGLDAIAKDPAVLLTAGDDDAPVAAKPTKSPKRPKSGR